MRILSFVALIAGSLAGQVVFDSIPDNMHFYQRDIHDNDSALVTVCGTVTQTGHTAVHVDVRKDAGTSVRHSCPLVYDGGSAPFRVHTKIHAELAQYQYTVYLDGSQITSRSEILCGDAYLFSGQSNGTYGAGMGILNDYKRTYGGYAGYSHDFDNYTWRKTILGGIASRVAELISATYNIPVFILNGALGGADIGMFLPNVYGDHGDTVNRTLYGDHYYNAVESGLKDKFRAFIWHQGEADGWDDSRAPVYKEKFDTLYRLKWKVDYPALEKVYIFQINTGCGGNVILRENQRKLTRIYDDLTAIATVGTIGHQGCHYEDIGYWQMAQNVFYAIARDFYGSKDTIGITSPNIVRAYCSESASPVQVFVEFDQNVVWPSDTLGNSMEDHFFLSNAAGYSFAGSVVSGEASGNTVILTLGNGVPKPDTIGYVDASGYEGPYIKNSRGMTALTFWDFPVDAEPSTFHEIHARRDLQEEAIIVTPNPFNPAATLTLPSQQPGGTLFVYTPEGKCVFERKCIASHIAFDGSGFHSGIYLIKYIEGNRTFSAKMTLLK